MEASRSWLFSATMLATATLLVSFLFPRPTIFQTSQAAGPTSLHQIQWDLTPIQNNDCSDAPTFRPVEDLYPIVSGFGLRRHPILQTNRLHAGVDFAAPKGAPVFAAGPGVIERISPLSDSSTFGIHVVILHDSSSVYEGQYRTLYAHLSSVSVRRGERVEEGQQIGSVGSTGRSTSAHLHYEIHLDDSPVDPKEYLHTDHHADSTQHDPVLYEEFLIR